MIKSSMPMVMVVSPGKKVACLCNF